MKNQPQRKTAMKTAVQMEQTAVLYARVSSKAREREDFSVPAPLKIVQGYAREPGITIETSGRRSSEFGSGSIA
jgi:hypothetical protein